MVVQMVSNQGEWRGEDNILLGFQHDGPVGVADDEIQAHGNAHL